MPKKYYEYEVTYRIHDGYQFNDPKTCSFRKETIRATSIDHAYSIALERAETPSLIAHDPVTVFKKDIRRIPGKALRKFNVTLYYHTCGTVTVFAENEKEAEAEAILEAGKSKYDQMFIHNFEEDSSPDVVECDDGD